MAKRELVGEHVDCPKSSGCHGGLPNGERLFAFFREAKLLLRKPPSIPAGLTRPDYQRLLEIFEALRQPLATARSGKCANPWHTAGLGTDEVRISAVLARLWNREEYGDAALSFLSAFFARTDAALPSETELRAGYLVTAEHCPNGNASDRIDITVETSKMLIGIEIKIYAAEGQGQLVRYQKAIANRAKLMKRDRHTVIFLAPYSPSVRTALPSSWASVAAAARSVDSSTAGGWLINQFGEFSQRLGS